MTAPGRGTILILAAAGDPRGPTAAAALKNHGGLFGLPWLVRVCDPVEVQHDERDSAVAVVAVEEWADDPGSHAERLITKLRAAEPAEPAPIAPARKTPLTAKVGRETAGRRGKGVVTVFDVSIADAELKELAATLKNRCGTGGTVKDGRIEIQGDIRDRVVSELEKLGYKVKRVGG